MPKRPVRSNRTTKRWAAPVRDGKPSQCLWLYDQADLMTQMQFIEWRNPDADYYGRLLHLLREGRRVPSYGTGMDERSLAESQSA